MKIIFILSLVTTVGCATKKPKTCSEKAMALISKANNDDNLIYIQSLEARSPRGATQLLHNRLPAFHSAGSSLKFQRARHANSEGDYHEFYKTSLWTLSDGYKKQPELVCQDKKGDYHAYALINVREIKNFLLK